MEKNSTEEFDRIKRIDFTQKARTLKRLLIAEFPDLYRQMASRHKELVGRRTVHTNWFRVVALHKNPHECKACGYTGLKMFLANGSPREYCSHHCLNTSDHAWGKRRASTKERFGSDNVFGSEYFKENLSGFVSNRYGAGHTSVSSVPEVKAKKASTSKERFGVDHWMKVEGAKEKLARSYEHRYGEGVRNAMHVQGVVDEMREKSLQKHGVNWASASPQIRKKVEATNLKKYGVRNAAKNRLVRRKITNSLNELWADEERAAEVRGKILRTFRRNWGADHPSHTAEYRDQNPGYKQHELTHLGQHFTYQGYEGDVIRECLDRGMKVKNKRLPTLRWGSNHVYHPDLLVKNPETGNILMVEVKSTWTLNGSQYGKSLDTNLGKFKAAVEYCSERGWTFYLALVHKDRVHWLKNPTRRSVVGLLSRVKAK